MSHVVKPEGIRTMSGQSAMTHALNSGPSAPVSVPVVGVSLVKAGDPVSTSRPRVSSTAQVDMGPYFGSAGWWGVPVWSVRGWIATALAEGRYADAAEMSRVLHGMG